MSARLSRSEVDHRVYLRDVHPQPALADRQPAPAARARVKLRARQRQRQVPAHLRRNQLRHGHLGDDVVAAASRVAHARVRPEGPVRSLRFDGEPERRVPPPVRASPGGTQVAEVAPRANADGRHLAEVEAFGVLDVAVQDVEGELAAQEAVVAVRVALELLGDQVVLGAELDLQGPRLDLLAGLHLVRQRVERPGEREEPVESHQTTRGEGRHGRVTRHSRRRRARTPWPARTSVIAPTVRGGGRVRRASDQREVAAVAPTARRAELARHDARG
mmetsp:Transcript_13491/g.60611  ORF Transcript_13491/g.60611 Transcript_13491/m.60611 type:complete len:275 (-) Transcript_13491:10-834(-)